MLRDGACRSGAGLEAHSLDPFPRFLAQEGVQQRLGHAATPQPFPQHRLQHSVKVSLSVFKPLLMDT